MLVGDGGDLRFELPSKLLLLHDDGMHRVPVGFHQVPRQVLLADLVF